MKRKVLVPKPITEAIGAFAAGNVRANRMAKLSTAEIKKLAISIVKAHPGGIRYAELIDSIATANPETPKNTVHGSVWNLAAVFPEEVTKPSRGLFKPVGTGDEEDAGETIETTATTEAGVKLKESDFYNPFSQWLKNDLDEVTTAVLLGGAGLKSKWGTPDVVGVYKPLLPTSSNSLWKSFPQKSRLLLTTPLSHSAKQWPIGSFRQKPTLRSLQPFRKKT